MTISLPLNYPFLKSYLLNFFFYLRMYILKPIRFSKPYRFRIAAEGTLRENAIVENQEMLNAYARRLKNCRWYLAANQRKLEEMQEAFKTCTKLNRVLDRLKVLTPARKPWIEDQQYKLAAKLASCNEAAQAPVKKQVHLLIAEAAYLSFIPGVESIRG